MVFSGICSFLVFLLCIKRNQSFIPTIIFVSIYILNRLAMTRKMQINNVARGYFCLKSCKRLAYLGSSRIRIFQC